MVMISVSQGGVHKGDPTSPRGMPSARFTALGTGSRAGGDGKGDSPEEYFLEFPGLPQCRPAEAAEYRAAS